MGFPRPTAVKLVQNTFLGAAAQAVGTDRHLVQMRNDITSPGGVTAAALYVLEKGGMRTTLMDAVFIGFASCYNAVCASINFLHRHEKSSSLGKSGLLPDHLDSGLDDDSF
eukprot:m.273971 g.273971  ORF g.273971 m.273971 type:complete len:111 (-) comp16285_c0_seq2:142-474(-)